MIKTNLSTEQLLTLIIMGIENKNYKAVKRLAQEALDQLKETKDA